MSPQTVYDVLVMLAEYHEARASRYAELAKTSRDPRADLLLEHLVGLESQSARVIRAELHDLSRDQSTYLPSGPPISPSATHANDCACDSDPSFRSALTCAMASDRCVDEWLDRIENSSPAATIAELAKRLRDFETTKSREISKFTRED